MGLDMYLSGKRYVSKFFYEGDGDRQIAIANQFPELKDWGQSLGDASPVKQVEIEAGYWRKANAVHQWFVENVQGGEDDCKSYPVSRENLIRLRDCCQEVLDNHEKAPELMKTAHGFFFGSTAYDEWYFKDLESTVEIVNRCLLLPENWEFTYRSSW